MDENKNELKKKWFSLLDLKSGFWQIKLDKEASNLCTLRFYKFKRLPFGIRYVPEEFQKQNQKYFRDIKILFYILIPTEDEMSHEKTVKKV